MILNIDVRTQFFRFKGILIHIESQSMDLERKGISSIRAMIIYHYYNDDKASQMSLVSLHHGK